MVSPTNSCFEVLWHAIKCFNLWYINKEWPVNLGYCAVLLTIVSTKNKNSLIITFPCAISQGKDVCFMKRSTVTFCVFELILWMCNIAFERVSTTKIALVFWSHSYLVSKCLIVSNVSFIGFAEKESHVKFKTFSVWTKKPPKEVGKYRIIDSQEIL